MTNEETKDHYSYRVYADPEVARSFDKERFGGEIGELIKKTQQDLVFTTLPDVQGWKVADIGAGTGRITIPFLEAGASVSACDASVPMLEVLKEKIKSPSLQVFAVDAHQLQFDDQSFDCAVSFRLLLHVVDWKKVMSEICRISKDWIVIDFAAHRGFLVVAPSSLWYNIRRLSSKVVQPYRTIPVNAVKNELQIHGFEIIKEDPGYFLPLVFYRKIGSAGFMKTAEQFFGAVGLTGIAGSPCTIFARRKR
jgi:ubiquinone/menaquinone biosynthesis C-methylase UbiE